MCEAKPQLVVITKAPRAGGGKSRLAASLGAEAAAELATAFLADTVQGCRSEEWKTSVHFTPAEGRGEIVGIVPDVRLVAQGEGDLGERILGAMADSIGEGARTVLIGSDTPGLPLRIVADAFAALVRQPLVLGPATDGGFYLIGLMKIPFGLFDGVAWSTDTVLETVMTNAERIGLGTTLLEEWRDVDDEDGLLALAGDLRRRGGRAPATLQAIERHVRVATEVRS